MDESLIDDETLSLDRRSRLPGTGFFYPDTFDRSRDGDRIEAAVAGSEAVIVTDGDADGLACAALVREAYDAAVDPGPFLAEYADRSASPDAGTADDESEELGADDAADAEAAAGSDPDGDASDASDGNDENDPGDADDDPLPPGVAESPVGVVPSGPRGFADDLTQAVAHLDEGVDLYVCDICPDSITRIEEPLRRATRRAETVRWFDHHQWDPETAEAVRESGVDLVVGESDEECSADVTRRSLDSEFDDRFAELVAVTRDHDLWLKEDERSDDLADFAVWTEPEPYTAIVGRYGVDLPEPVRAFLARRREEKTALIEKAVARAETHTVDDWTVGVTYGRCSQNEVAERLRETGHDAAVIVKPAGSASVRGSDGFERAHEVADLVNGGGHPQAAGCKPDIYDDMLDYARHWTTEGEAAKRVILAAFERVAERAAAEDRQPVE